MNPRKTMCLLLVFLWLPTLLFGAVYVQANYGFGGSTDEPSWGGELGAVFLSDLHPQGNAFSLGMGFSIGDTDENPPDAMALPAGSGLATLKTYNDGNEYEGYVSCGAELVPSFFGVVSVGYATQKEVGVAQSAGIYYETDSKTEKYLTGMASLRYVVEGMSIGLGFHTRRGIVGSFGFAF